MTAVLLAIACLGLFRLDANGLSTEEHYTKEFDSVVGQKVLTRPRPRRRAPTRSWWWPTPTSADEVRRTPMTPGRAASARRPTARAVQDGVAFITATDRGRRHAPQAAFDTVERVRDAVHAVDGADALVGGTSAIYVDIEKRLDPRQPGDHPGRPARRAADPDACCCGPWSRRCC